jgi:hypothetical protein
VLTTGVVQPCSCIVPQQLLLLKTPLQKRPTPRHSNAKKQLEVSGTTTRWHGYN